MLGSLNISEAMSIALHTCASLAEQPDRYQSAREISERLGFSAHHFAKVVQQLVRAGILVTERGPAGGSPDYTGCLLKHEICKGDGCALGKLMAKENERLIELLKTVTLESIVRSLKRNRKGGDE